MFSYFIRVCEVASATLGAACISGVPALGLPKINELVGGIFTPALSA